MFIRLTRLDNSPIWLNAAFIVTVEPRKGGGSVVVPVGDGLDYDVRETPEAVLALLGDAPAPAILPIPTKDALTPTPEDVSPETDAQLVSEARQSAEKSEPSAEKSAPADATTDEPKPAKRTRKTATTTTAKKPRATRKKKPALPLPPEDVERLSRMRPKSLKKLQNTLQSQFKVEDVATAIEALAANAVFTLEQERVLWPTPDPV